MAKKYSVVVIVVLLLAATGAWALAPTKIVDPAVKAGYADQMRADGASNVRMACAAGDEGGGAPEAPSAGRPSCVRRYSPSFATVSEAQYEGIKAKLRRRSRLSNIEAQLNGHFDRRGRWVPGLRDLRIRHLGREVYGHRDKDGNWVPGLRDKVATQGRHIIGLEATVYGVPDPRMRKLIFKGHEQRLTEIEAIINTTRVTKVVHGKKIIVTTPGLTKRVSTLEAGQAAVANNTKIAMIPIAVLLLCFAGATLWRGRRP